MKPHRFIWNKHSRIYTPDDSVRWMSSHAQSPTAYLINENKLRLYFAVRNHEGQPLTIYLDCNPEYPEHISYFHTHPVLPVGSVGVHDQDGIVPSSCINKGDHIKLYYTGWNTRDFQQYQVTAASARSYDDGQTFVASSPLIFLGREFFNTMSPWVIKVDRYYHIWFAASDNWVEKNGQVEALYNIYHGVSDDGWTWLVDDQPLFPLQKEGEVLTRPSVWSDGQIWHMWFSCRSAIEQTCTLGYAYSKDMRTWTRNDQESVLTTSSMGWDSDMLTYPCVLQYQNSLIMFYNGNNYGATGFGYATLEL